MGGVLAHFGSLGTKLASSKRCVVAALVRSGSNNPRLKRYYDFFFFVLNRVSGRPVGYPALPPTCARCV